MSVVSIAGSLAATPQLLRLAALGLERDLTAGRYNACDHCTLMSTKRLAKLLGELADGADEQAAMLAALDRPAPEPTAVRVPWFEMFASLGAMVDFHAGVPAGEHPELDTARALIARFSPETKSLELTP